MRHGANDEPLEMVINRSAGFRSGKRRWLPVATASALAGLTFLLYLPTLEFDFTNYDDPLFVTENPHVKDGLSWKGVKWAFATLYGFYHPITWLSFMVDAQMFGLNPGGFHFTNVLLHVSNSVLLFLCFFRMTGRHWCSALVASLFAFHPINVESVAWISERKGLLSAWFGLLTLHAYVWYVQSPKLSRYMSILIFCLLGFLCKSNLIMLPFVMFLLDFWPLGRLSLATWRGVVDLPTGNPSGGGFLGNLFREKMPLIVLSVVFCAVTLVAESKAGAVKPLEAYPFKNRVQNALVSYVKYMEKMIRPNEGMSLE